MLSKAFFIDDDHVALMLNKKLVEKTSFANEVVTATHGHAALDYYSELANSQNPNPDYPRLIFLDLNMPIMDGWEFLEEFSTTYYPRFPETKIVVLSSSINPEDLKRSMQYPMVLEFISKPVTVEILQKLMKNYQI